MWGTAAILAAFLPIISGQIVPTEDYPYSVDILNDSGYKLFWKFDSETVTFEIHVQSTGWIGLGISPNGGMTSSDIMIGWVDDEGTPTITDRFATSEGLPAVDTTSQDWHLLTGSQTSTHTMLKFWRYRLLCDQNDRNITTDGMYSLIWAYGTADPEAGGQPGYHANRGAININLLSWLQESINQLPADAVPLDLMNPAVAVPEIDTMYWCQKIKLPEIPKHHIVAVEPVITAGNEMVVHHIVLLACYDEYEESEDGQGSVCMDNADSTAEYNCIEVMVAWAVGGQTDFLPEHIGMPIGGESPPNWVLMQTHYDNSIKQSGVVDSSGLRLWMTSTLRENEAATLEAGVTVTTYGIVIPPGQPDFLVEGHCVPSCLEKGLTEDIHVYSVMLHTHTLGDSIRIRHFRDGVELPPIIEDYNYDFNYQRTIRLPSEVTIKPTDYFLVDCLYVSENRETVTFGGEGTYDEMCLAFLNYYPKQNIAVCTSMPTLEQIATPLGYSVHYDGTVLSPESVAGMSLEEALQDVDWTDEDLQMDFLESFTSGYILDVCATRDPELGMSIEVESLPYPTINQVYSSTQAQCHSGLDDPAMPDGPIPGELLPTEYYPNKLEILANDEYNLYWRCDSNSVTLEIHVRTTGWVGFGISPTGGMKNADIMIGWVSGGIATVTDRYATGTSMPSMDEASQDYHLISAYETDTHTILKFWRFHQLCDEQDVDITEEQLYSVIWAYGANDGEEDLAYHMSRGSVSVDLMAATDTTPDLPADVFAMDILNDAVPIPMDPTTYWCHMYMLPEMTEHHIIGMEPVIAPGSEMVMHHILLFACFQDTLDESMNGMNDRCDSEVMYPCGACKEIVLAWAIGGGPFYMPEHTGFPVGGDNLPKYFCMQTHYDNQAMVNDIVDESGVRMLLTPTLRPYDASMLPTGLAPTSHQMIPPGMSAFQSDGHCMSDCTSQGLSEDIHVFGAGLHAHTAARAIKLRHFRDGVELPPIQNEPDYDFHFQKIRHLNEEITIMPGDNLVVECVYNTEDRDFVTFGGEGTSDEMCLAFLMYYPRQGLSWCISLPSTQQSALGLGFTLDADEMIISPTNLLGQSIYDALNTVDWTDTSTQQSFQEAVNTGGHITGCIIREGDEQESQYGYSSIPEIAELYQPPPEECYSGPVGNIENPEPSEDYPHEMALQPNHEYQLYWKFDEETITFEIHVKTSGWAGFGLSPTGGMPGADIMIGWVSDDDVAITDRYATGHSTPLLDTASQDYHLLSGQEIGSHTILKFWRYHSVCDQNDVNITEELTYSVIWAYGASDNDGVPDYHDSRGSVSINLLAPEDGAPNLPDDAVEFLYLNEAVPVPMDPTMYWCKIFKVPDTLPTHHIIGAEPMIQPGSEPVLHHVVLYGCYHDIDDSADGMSGQCHDPHMLQFLQCIEIIVVWAVGGENLYMPANVGYPIGGGSKPHFLRMETHYDNLAQIQGLIDSSGLRVWMTPMLRDVDAAILSVGYGATDYVMIPPGMPEFRTNTHCSAGCVNKGLNENVKVFAVMLHGHTAARGIRLRHFRNGVELPPIYEDDNYDFNYQQIRMMREEVTIMPIDNLVVECTFNTEERDQVTYAGEGTFDEMCIAFIYYYPRQDLFLCGSASSTYQTATALGYQLNENGFVISPLDSTVLGLTVQEAINYVDWSNTSMQQGYQNAINNGTHFHWCITNEDDSLAIESTLMFVPNIDNPWVKEDQCYSGLTLIQGVSAAEKLYSASLLMLMLLCILFHTL